MPHLDHDADLHSRRRRSRNDAITGLGKLLSGG
jgi:hypothetical protein